MTMPGLSGGPGSALPRKPDDRVKVQVQVRAYIWNTQEKKDQGLRALTRASLKDPKGRPLIVTVKRLPLKRSLSQNRLYWAWVGLLAAHAGCHPLHMHDDLKEHFLGHDEHVNTVTGEVRRVLRSSAALETPQFTEYLNNVERLGADHFGVTLPQPNDDAGWIAIQEAYARVKHLADKG